MRFTGPAVCDCDDRPGELKEFLERLEEYAPGPFVPSMLRESQTEKLKQHARLTMEYCAIGNIPCRQSTPKGSLTLAHCRSMCGICLPRPGEVGGCMCTTYRLQIILPSSRINQIKIRHFRSKDANATWRALFGALPDAPTSPLDARSWVLGSYMRL